MPAENHPICDELAGTRARKRGAIFSTSIRVSIAPARSRTCSAKLRRGPTSLFVGGMINYAIEHNRIQEEYVRQVHECLVDRRRRLRFHRRAFRRLRSQDPQLRRTRWAYALDGDRAAAARPRRCKHPRCVFQLLKQHFSSLRRRRQCAASPARRGKTTCEVCDLYTVDLRAGPGRHVAVCDGHGPAQPRHAEHPLLCASCSSCSATSASPAAASTRCAASRTCRARPIRD